MKKRTAKNIIACAMPKSISINPKTDALHLSARDAAVLHNHAIIIMEQHGARTEFSGFHKRRWLSRWIVSGEVVEMRGRQDFDYLGINPIGSLLK